MTSATTAAAVLGIAAAVVGLSACDPAGPAPDGRGSSSPAALVTPVPTAVLGPTVAPASGAASLPAPGRPATSAAGGVAILASAARAQAVVVGTVTQPSRVDVSGWRAELRIDTALSGSLALGDVVTLAWEELSPSRAVRFGDGVRVLVVLDALPTQSLWRKRFPARDQSRPVLVVAAHGEAFLVRPDGPTVYALQHYLALTQRARAEGPGTRWLAELARVATPSLAREALALLVAEPGRLDDVSEEGGAALLATARGAQRDADLRGGALRLAARHRIAGTREVALELGAPGSSTRVDAFRALAMLPDGLTPEESERLLDETDPALRVVGLEIAGRRLPRARVVRLLRDADPAVRVAAGRAVLGREDAGIADVVALLDDPDASVRTGIAESIGGRGADAIPPLRAVVDGGSERAALAAILGISRAGPGAAAALGEIAEKHPNASVRAFAKLGLGEAPSSHDHGD